VALRIRNVGDRPLDTVLVRIDTAWTGGFSNLRAVPPFRNVWELVLTDLRADGTGRVRIELTAERYGLHRGRLSVATGSDTLRFSLGTRVLP
jgi:hypothetical protein